jgi:hypothetical protein
VAFDDRHTEFLVLTALIGVATAISIPVLQLCGCEGWGLGTGVIACIAASYGLILLASYFDNIFGLSNHKRQNIFTRTRRGGTDALLQWIKEVDGLSLIEKPYGIFNVRCIAVSSDISFPILEQLLRVMKENDQEFAFYDEYYPSPSDPGAYFNYSPKKSVQGKWRMTLGNHGWSGGIYEIEEYTICCQLKNLISKKRIDSIQIENVCFGSHYQLEKSSSNCKMNTKLMEIHALQ